MGPSHAQAGGRNLSAKQKTFGTVLATAPSLAFVTGAAKSPISFWGAFSRPLKTRGEQGGWDGGIPSPSQAKPRLPNNEAA
jgi:hypothetical protein